MLQSPLYIYIYIYPYDIGPQRKLTDRRLNQCLLATPKTHLGTLLSVHGTDV